MIYSNPLLKLKYFVFQKNEIPKDNIYYTGLGREALLKAVELLNIQQGNNVLVPAYICKTAIGPFFRKGVCVKYYKIKKDLSPDMESLKQAVNKETKALLYVNYFGITDYFERYQMFCRDNRLYIIEDNAHTLFKDFQLVNGDISFFSLRKFYPIPNGALLVTKNKEMLTRARYSTENIEEKLNISDYKFLIGSSARKIYHYISNRISNGLLIKFQKREKDHSREENLLEGSLSKRFSKLSFDIFNRINPQEIINRRRDNYLYLLNKLVLINCKYFKVLFKNLPDCACPLALPVMVEKGRGIFIKNLFLNGFITYPWPDWPDMPEQVKENIIYKDEHFLSNTITLLPIHQDLTSGQLEKIACIIKKWAVQIDGKS